MSDERDDLLEILGGHEWRDDTPPPPTPPGMIQPDAPWPRPGTAVGEILDRIRERKAKAEEEVRRAKAEINLIRDMTREELEALEASSAPAARAESLKVSASEILEKLRVRCSEAGREAAKVPRYPSPFDYE